MLKHLARVDDWYIDEVAQPIINWLQAPVREVVRFLLVGMILAALGKVYFLIAAHADWTSIAGKGIFMALAVIIYFGPFPIGVKGLYRDSLNVLIRNSYWALFVWDIIELNFNQLTLLTYIHDILFILYFYAIACSDPPPPKRREVIIPTLALETSK